MAVNNKTVKVKFITENGENLHFFQSDAVGVVRLTVITVPEIVTRLCEIVCIGNKFFLLLLLLTIHHDLSKSIETDRVVPLAPK